MNRQLDPNTIFLPPGYTIEVMHSNLNVPVGLEITEQGELYYGDSGVTDGNGKLIKITESGEQVIASGFESPLTGITYHKGEFYVTHRGSVTKVTKDGQKTDLLVGLPSYGDHHNNRVTFGPDGLMYFGQGTATNSGVVGLDNDWLKEYSYFHDYPAKPIKLNGHNFQTRNIIEGSEEQVLTGAFAPFGTPTYFNEVVRPILPGSGSVLRANADGSNLELFAWGLRNPFGIKFDRNNQLWVANHGMDVRGSRPIKNSPDEFRKVEKDKWYGWPDYTGGYPVTLPYFKPDNDPQPRFLLEEHPMIPQKPLVNFIPHSAIMGFDFSYSPDFGFVGDCFIAEFGPQDPHTTGGEMLKNVGHKVTRIDMNTGQLFVFAQNKLSNASGLSRPIDIKFDQNKSMYILDFGGFEPKKGVIWKVTKT